MNKGFITHQGNEMHESDKFANFAMMFPKGATTLPKIKKQYSFHINLISLSIHGRCGWFKILGFGIQWKDARESHELFSERMGITKYLEIGNFRLFLLYPKFRLFKKKYREQQYGYQSFKIDNYTEFISNRNKNPST